ncbi:MAG: FAD-binding domain-containing protein [Pseudomonadota bacterium]
MISGTATRAEGLRLVEAFTPRMGKRYASGRNYDRGPGRHSNVSCLSPFIRRRLITEKEVTAAALADHGLEGAEKFIHEVFWRGYFKGWLERRPQVWADYVSGLSQDLIELDIDRSLRKRIEAAENGITGLECFDAWVSELVETGYLHNHARMWFASIWIFTLELPWRLGADFFYRHLLDGDPASNTCSWRWVAGLHTRGKAYEAKAWNIAKFTDQRFTPNDAELSVVPSGLEQQEPDGLPDIMPLRDVVAPKRGIPTVLLMTEDDCFLEDFDLNSLNIIACASLSTSHLRSHRDVPDLICNFEEAALNDCALRIGMHPVQMHAGLPSDLAKWTVAKGAKQIAMPYVPVGPLSDWIEEVRPKLEDEGLALTEFRRDWDALIWPHASAGFFKVKKKLPEILSTAGLL